MKHKTILVICLLAILVLACEQKQAQQIRFDENSKLTTLGKIWGFLKYYHPAVLSNSINWDDELLRMLGEMDSMNSKQEFNIIISELIFKLNCIENPISQAGVDTTSTLLNSRLVWLEDTSILSFNNASILKDIYKAKQPYENKYVTKSSYAGHPEFINDSLYTKGSFPSKNLRLLALFRYWNIINYFYPHHDINDHNWDFLLFEYVPQFIEIQDTLDYHLKVKELACLLNDGHIVVDSWELAWHFGFLSPPYKLTWIEEQPIISGYLPDSLGVLQDLHIGDIIMEIDDIPVQEIVNAKSKYFPFSNHDHLYRLISYQLMMTASLDSLKIKIQRHDSILNVMVKPIYFFELYPALNRENKKKKEYRIINDTIGYLDLELLELSEVDSVMNQLLNMKKLIIDIRNYPNGVLYELSNYLYTDSTDFVRIIDPNYNKPGKFYHAHTFKSGMGRDKVFKGKVILLVNEQTQSHAEFTVMCFQASPNVITVGSTTAGADGNMTWVWLPGEIKTSFTSLGIDYPDGSPTQRVGVKIDHFIKPTIDDIRMGRDPVLEFAIGL